MKSFQEPNLQIIKLNLYHNLTKVVMPEIRFSSDNTIAKVKKVI